MGTPQIVIVDDDREDRAFLKRGFQEIGYSGFFLDFDSAIEFEFWLESLPSKEQYPELIILDIHMPKVTGLDFLRSMHENGISKKIKICMISSSSANEYYALSDAYGALKYFVKPMSLPGYSRVAQECLDLITAK